MTFGTMKKAAVAAAVLAWTLTIAAEARSLGEKNQQERQERTVKSFMTSLRSGYPGVVEGTIYNIVVFKKLYPQLDYADLIGELNRSSLENDDVALRYKAHLASLYLTNAATIEIEPAAHPSDHEYLFRQIAQQLETKFLVAK